MLSVCLGFGVSWGVVQPRDPATIGVGVGGHFLQQICEVVR